MSELETMECGQDGCEHKAAYRYTWPGRDEAGICVNCKPRLLQIADALTLYLQLIPVGTEQKQEGEG